MRFVGCTGAAQTCTNCTELPLAPHHTPSPIPRIAPKVAPKRATQTPAPRINSTKSFLRKTKGNNKTDSPTTSKWQIGLFLWQKAARREPERSAASAKRAVTPHRGSRGAAPGAPLVTFPATGKSPGVEGRSAPSWGCGGLQPPLRGAKSQV